jgi:serine/threonine protein kinase
MNRELPDIPGYDVEAELGRGGMGIVYKARQRTTGTVLALKMILFGRDATFQELARFRIEAEAMACLDHPNIIKIHDVGVFAGYPSIALDFARRLRRLPGGDMPLLVAVTGYGREEDVRRCKDAGIDHHFVKPVDPDVLQQLLDQAKAAIDRTWRRRSKDQRHAE